MYDIHYNNLIKHTGNLLAAPLSGVLLVLFGILIVLPCAIVCTAHDDECHTTARTAIATLHSSTTTHSSHLFYYIRAKSFVPKIKFECMGLYNTRIKK
jgi:hypothetical protein